MLYNLIFNLMFRSNKILPGLGLQHRAVWGWLTIYRNSNVKSNSGKYRESSRPVYAKST